MTDLTHKTCTKCGETKPLSAFHKANNGRGLGGVRGDCKECRNGYGRDRYAANHEWVTYYRDKGLQRRYGITLADYEEMYVQQAGVCALCGQSWEPNLLVDHDHDTGQVRGLLCDWCNKAIGFAKDDPALLRAMAVYVEEYR